MWFASMVYCLDWPADACGSTHEDRSADGRALKARLDTMVGQFFSQKKPTEAISYVLDQWSGLTLFLSDGRVGMDSNTVERSMRPIAIGRRNSATPPTAPIVYSSACIPTRASTKTGIRRVRRHSSRTSQVLFYRARFGDSRRYLAGGDQQGVPVIQIALNCTKRAAALPSLRAASLVLTATRSMPARRRRRCWRAAKSLSQPSQEQEKAIYAPDPHGSRQSTQARRSKLSWP
jgi:hypothetical protein